MSRIGSGVQGGTAIVAPSYHKYVTQSTLTFTPGVPQTFGRVTGPHRIIMTFSPRVGYSVAWSFALTGGTNAVSPDVLPMFPRDPQKLYNPTINYRINGDDLPSYGCSILALPVPPKSAMTTRVNVFEVTETVTGLGLVFTIAECPYAGVEPTVACNSNVTVDMKVISYRACASNSRAIGWLESRGAPFYVVRNFPTLFISSGITNPLDSHTPLPFKRISGQQTILVSDTSGFYFSFDVDYGIIGQGNGYIGSINSRANASLASKDIENATLVSINSPSDPGAVIKMEQFTITAGDGRTYIFTFDPNGDVQVQPTIQLLAGPPLGPDSLTVNVFVRFFQTL